MKVPTTIPLRVISHSHMAARGCLILIWRGIAALFWRWPAYRLRYRAYVVTRRPDQPVLAFWEWLWANLLADAARRLS